MNQEIVIALNVSIYGSPQDANLVSHQSCSDEIFFVRQNAGKRTGQGGHMFERKHPTPTKPEATLGDTLDLRISGQPEELLSLVKQVMMSPDTSTVINDLIKNYSQKNAARVD